MSGLRYFGTATRGGLRLLLGWIGAVVGAVAAALVGLTLWLAQGPVSVGFLTPYLQDALRDSGLEIEIADTVIEWRGFDEGLDVRLTDARLRGRGADAAQVVLPAVHLRLSGRALMRGELRPAALEVDGAKLRLVREADGRFEMGLGSGEGAPDAGFGEWLRQSFAGEAGATMDEFRRVVLRGADLELEDRALGRTFRAPRTDLAVWREAGTVGASLSGAIEFGATPVNVVLDARWRGGGAPVEAALRFDGLDPAALAGLDPALQPLAALRMGLSGRVQGSFTREGPTAPMGFTLAGVDGVLALPERFPKPVALRRLELRGELGVRMQAGMPALERLRADHLELLLGQATGPRLAGSATLTLSEAGPGIVAQAAITGLALKELELYWPIGMAANARSWVTANIQDGVVPEAKLAVNLAPGALANPPREAVLFQFQFEGVTAEYIKRMPKITQGKGQARIDGHEFQLDLATGRAGKLALSEGKLTIDGLHVRDQNADIQLVVTGTLPAGLELLDSPPLGLASRFGFAPANAGGNAAARLRFAFPVEHSLTMEQVRFAVAANVTELSLKGLFDQYELARGTASISVNPKGLAAEGQGALAGIPLTFKWREEFGVPGAPSRYEASGELDGAARARLGLAADAYLAGPVPVAVNAAVRRGGAVEAKVEATLDRATLKLDEIEWRKAGGVPARASAVLRTAGGGAPLRVDELTLDAADLSVRGRLELDKDSLRLAELSRVKWAEADIVLRLERDARGNANATLSGSRIDLRRLNPPPGAKPPPPSPRPIPGPVDTSRPRIAVKIARLDRLQLSDSMSFGQVAGELELYGGRLGSLRARATLDDGPPLSVTIAPAGKRRSVLVTSGDAAKLARALDLLQGAEGGKLSVSGELRDDEPGGPLVGRVLVDEFRLVRAPILARILSLGSLTGISDLMTGSGIAFTRLEIPFTQLDDVITIAEARAVGPALGLTAEGTVDRAKDRLDLRGTVVPAYTINSVLGNIPLLGTLLVGRKGEGVFAITFKVSGPADDPGISVNPLTALAPGFLRTIIGVLERGIEQSLPGGPAPSDAPGSERR